MFDVFRQNVKECLKENKMTYCQLSKTTEMAESTIKSFMSGASDSRRVAEKIADALGHALIYCDGTYLLKFRKEEREKNEQRNQNF